MSGRGNVRAQVGDVFMSRNYGEVVVLKVYGSESADVQFVTTGYTRNIALKYLYKGKFSDATCLVKRGKKPVHGLTQDECHREWVAIMQRGDLETQLKMKKYESYIGVSVAEEFKCVKRYKAWYDAQEFSGARDYLGKRYNIEKDILTPGNMQYAPEHCAHVPTVINSFFTFLVQPRKSLMGITNSGGKKMPFTATMGYWPYDYVNLGTFSTEEEACAAYYAAKRDQAIFLAECFDGYVDKRIVKAMEDFTVEKYLIPKQEWCLLPLEDKKIRALL